MANLSNFTERLKEKMVQTPELIVAHLYGYLGFLAVLILGKEQSEILYLKIVGLLKKQAISSYEQFSKHPLCADDSNRIENLEKLGNSTPQRIVAQTVRLGGVVIDSINEQSNNRKYDLIIFNKSVIRKNEN